MRIEQIDEVGTILDQAVTAGGNRIQNIGFESSDRTALLEQARAAAWDDALAKAQQYAALADATLGEVLNINTFEQPSGPGPQAAFARDTGGSVPVQAGTQSITIEVQVTWCLE